MEEKFEESEFFLKKIKETDPDLSQVKHYFSAFLYSIESIPDYLLAEAAIRYNLGLTLEEDGILKILMKEPKRKTTEAQEYYQKWSNIRNMIDTSSIGRPSWL